MSKITYENKIALSEKPEIDDINKVKANDMNEIKQVVNQNDDNVGNLQYLETTDKTSVVNAINEIITQNSYSLEETFTGKYWIDGKPIYRKVITNTSISLNQWVTIPHSILSLDLGMIKNAYIYRNDGTYIPINSEGTNYFTCQINENNFLYKISGFTNITKIIVILEYTKTTD